jgi:protein phosphatase PTC6
LTLAYLKADHRIHAETKNGAQHCGSTASVVLIQSLDKPAQPHFASQQLHLTIAQVGDTRVLLCDTALGEVWALTDRHHAESRVESDRLRRMGTDKLISDSFGETRWMGAIENTRGFGDFEWKSSGVTVEPEVTHRVIKGSEYAYLVFVTDGLTSLLSDQELVDLARQAADPTRAAKTIVHFGEDLGAQDNCTCIVVPLAGWGKIGGEDTTETRREYRRSQASRLNTRMQRM